MVLLLSKNELNGLSKRKSQILIIGSFITIIIVFAVLRSIDPFELLPEGEQIFHSMSEIVYLLMGIGIGYIPIGIISLRKKKFI